MSFSGNGLRANDHTHDQHPRSGASWDSSPMAEDAAAPFARVVLAGTSISQAMDLVAEQGLRLSQDIHAVLVQMPEAKGTLRAVAGAGPIDISSLTDAPLPHPGSDAAGQGRIQVIRSLMVESRWPEFTNHALYCGVQSLVACPLGVDGEILGSLVLYSSREAAFESRQAAAAQALADRAAVLLANVRSYEAAAALSAQLGEALKSRAVIDQAKGILMATEGLTADEAFDKIKNLSQATNIKVRDLARQIVAGVAPRDDAPSGRV